MGNAMVFKFHGDFDASLGIATQQNVSLQLFSPALPAE